MDASETAAALRAGLVIPAHPLALTAERTLDERRQVALTRYYCDAGAGGVAVGVHTTQFAIREAGLLRPVLTLARDTVRSFEAASGRRLVKVAGVCGPTSQALSEAALARELGYDAGLLSLGALREATTDELVTHCRRVAEVVPIFGFYLQPAVGGRLLDYSFWRRFLEIGNRRGDQGRTLQPVPDARRGPRSRRQRTRRRGRALHRQRRRDRPRPPRRLPGGKGRDGHPFRGRAAGPVGGVDAPGRAPPRGDPGLEASRRRGGAGPALPRPPAHRRQRRLLRRPQRLPRLHRGPARGAAPPGDPRRDGGASTRARTSRPDRQRRSIASSGPTRTSTTMRSSRRTATGGCGERAPRDGPRPEALESRRVCPPSAPPTASSSRRRCSRPRATTTWC